uniref:Uncharacterized protein n=1 Tax=Physcomitrium patens TaxID=3218 RepID=A0A2K1JYE8_PHYPA|nr:hypothetical protein PHYPA_013676 [Physcomitrium patens]
MFVYLQAKIVIRIRDKRLSTLIHHHTLPLEHAFLRSAPA